MGDNNIRVGKTYTTNSNFTIENHPEITSSITEEIKYQTLEDVLVNAGSFGHCLKMKETATVNMKNEKTGATFFGEASAYHWLAKNVGKVKSRIIESNVLPHYTFELSSAYVNNLSIPKIAQAENDSNLYSSPLSYLIKESFKKLL